ncbi:thermonuclease family protein [Hoeflea alexandrii]|uniref:Thermonuclease family protein n=3 Tax=Hoeflea alexandrii TaxID=288436 RepID=A0ABT1CMG6_9HYPH|nr:thermonuclease family protein [Hoeflea alexandrii]MCO6407365.1 thermonuclease family protein [Hoeflea alexandrii]
MRNTLLTICVLVATSPAAASDIAGRASVVDGDTIEIQGKRIRFDGIDAPEARQSCQDATGKSYRCGRVSAEALDAFLAKSRPTACTVTGKSWDRFVAACRRADGADVNRWMVANGHAIDWPKYSRGRYASVQREAKAQKRGIWAGKFEWPCVVRGAKCD